MKKTTIRLAAATMTAATMLLTPVLASAQPVNKQPIVSMSKDAAMAGHHKGGNMSASTMDMAGSRKSMAGMSMGTTNGKANKMRGHATMADAVRAHPELEKMCKAMMSMTGTNAMANKMRGHATMTDAMRAHPELTSMS